MKDQFRKVGFVVVMVLMIGSCRMFESTSTLKNNLRNIVDPNATGNGLLDHIFDEKIRVCIVATHLPLSNLEEHRMLFEKSYDLWLMNIRKQTQRQLAAFEYLTADSGCQPHIINDRYSPLNHDKAEVTLTITDSPVVHSSVVLEEGGRVSFFIPASKKASLTLYIHSMGHGFNIPDDDHSDAMGHSHAAHQPTFLSRSDYKKIDERVCDKYSDFLNKKFCE